MVSKKSIIVLIYHRQSYYSGQIITCVIKITEEKSGVCLNFPPAYEYREYFEIRKQ
jgi:hypothetical protein